MSRGGSCVTPSAMLFGLSQPCGYCSTQLRRPLKLAANNRLRGSFRRKGISSSGRLRNADRNDRCRRSRRRLRRRERSGGQPQPGGRLAPEFQSNHPSRPEHDHQGSSGNAGGTALAHRFAARLHPFVQPGRAGARHTHALRDGGNGGHGVFCFLRPAERGHNRRRHGWHRSCVQKRRRAAARSGRGCSRASNWPGATAQYSPQ